MEVRPVRARLRPLLQSVRPLPSVATDATFTPSPAQPYSEAKMNTPDTVFTIRDGEWRARLNGRVLPTIWNTRGAAAAGLEVERRRDAQRRSRGDSRLGELYAEARQSLGVRASILAVALAVEQDSAEVAVQLGFPAHYGEVSEPVSVEHICPPVPSGAYDWQATRRDSYEPGQPLGHGPTRYAAAVDLLEQEGRRRT